MGSSGDFLINTCSYNTVTYEPFRASEVLLQIRYSLEIHINIHLQLSLLCRDAWTIFTSQRVIDKLYSLANKFVYPMDTLLGMLLSHTIMCFRHGHKVCHQIYCHVGKFVYFFSNIYILFIFKKNVELLYSHKLYSDMSI